MSKADSLIERMLATNVNVIQVAESCSATQWQLPVVEEDGRPVGIVFHHIAIAYPFALDWAQKISAGESLPDFDREALTVFNAQHAQEQTDTSQADTIAYLRQVTEETSAALLTLSDEQLERTAPNPLVGGQEFSGEWVMQAFAIGHAEGHLKAIKATVGMA
ncbi:MAG: DinB family protein [Chloroflexi bacterium]|nr:DinB family protein [Chloroflexota bacterium]